MTRSDEPTGFIARWSRRKALAREQPERDTEPAPPSVPQTTHTPHEVPMAAVHSAPSAANHVAPAAGIPPPTLDDVAALLPSSADFSRFVASGVPAQVQHAALSKLFSDPHFNVMDGLDVYIEDYNRPTPLPTALLHKMLHRKTLGIFTDEERAQQLALDQAREGALTSPTTSALSNSMDSADSIPNSERLGTEMAAQPAAPASPSELAMLADADTTALADADRGLAGPGHGAHEKGL